MKTHGVVLIAMLSVVGCAAPEGASETAALEEAGAGELGTESHALGCAIANDGQTTLRFINKCGVAVNFAGTNISGGSLASGQEACRTIGSNTQRVAAQRYWGSRSGESLTSGRVSLAEFTFNETFYSWNSYDWFNLSHVDAHNLPLKIIPYELGSGTTCSTMTRSCPKDLLPGCPSQGQVRNSAGKIVSCVSPNRDDPNNPVARYFDAACAQSYSWSGDNSSMASCNAEDFDIVFCPPN